MEYGWIDLNTSQGSPSNVKTPGAVARVKEDSEAFVAVDKNSSQGHYGAGQRRHGDRIQGRPEAGGPADAAGGADRRSAFRARRPSPAGPSRSEPADNLSSTCRASTEAGAGLGGGRRRPRATRCQVSRNHLFVDNVIDVEQSDQDPRHPRACAAKGPSSGGWRPTARTAFRGRGARHGNSASTRFGPADGEGDKTPPKLDLDDVKSYGSIFIVGGRTEPGARVEINGEQVKAAADGSFTKTVQLGKEGWSFIEIRARDAAGNETVRRHRAFVENP